MMRWMCCFLVVCLFVAGPVFADLALERNVRLIRGLWEAPLTDDSIGRYEDFVAEDVQIHGPHGQERFGLSTLKAIDTQFATAFQEISSEIRDLFAAEDRVVVYWKWHAIHVDDYEGFPATGNTVTLSGMVMYRINDEGKIAEVWAAWDHLGLFKQIADVTITGCDK